MKLIKAVLSVVLMFVFVASASAGAWNDLWNTPGQALRCKTTKISIPASGVGTLPATNNRVYLRVRNSYQGAAAVTALRPVYFSGVSATTTTITANGYKLEANGDTNKLDQIEISGNGTVYTGALYFAMNAATTGQVTVMELLK